MYGFDRCRLASKNSRCIAGYGIVRGATFERQQPDIGERLQAIKRTGKNLVGIGTLLDNIDAGMAALQAMNFKLIGLEVVR